MKLTGRVYFLIFIIVVMAGAIAMAASWPFLAAKLVPILTASFILVMACIQLVRNLVPARQAAGVASSGKKAKAGDSITVSGEGRRFVMVLVWVIGFIVSIYLLGFLVSIPLFVITYLKSRGRGWLSTILIAAFALVSMYGIFEYGLKLPLYEGLLFSMFS